MIGKFLNVKFISILNIVTINFDTRIPSLGIIILAIFNTAIIAVAITRDI